MWTDPLPWMRRHKAEYFVSSPELSQTYTERRGYTGLQTHIMFIKPSAVVFRILVDQGLTKSYVPFTNTEQDVLETVFSPHRKYPPFMRHRHHFRECLSHNMTKDGYVWPVHGPVK